MADVLTKEQRSKNMAAVRSKLNKSTEVRFVKLLKENKIKGWRRHYKYKCGTADFVFLKQKIAIFIDGCFWHGCPKHFILPKSGIEFWKNKIDMNIERDKRINKCYKKEGWKIVRIWEHEIKKDSKKAVNKIVKFLK